MKANLLCMRENNWVSMEYLFAIRLWVAQADLEELQGYCCYCCESERLWC